METADIAEQISGEHPHHHVSDETFRKRVGIFIGVLALALAVIGLGGGNAMKRMINANIEASDHFAFYQARNIRQTSVNIAADELELFLAGRTDLPAAAEDGIRAKIDTYRKLSQRWESDPKGGEGKEQLLARAKAAQERRDEAQARDSSFEFGEAMLQIAIVLASTSILTASRPLIALSASFALLGLLLGVNGYLLLFRVPELL